VSGPAKSTEIPDPTLGETGRLPASVWKICAVAALGSLLAQLDATIVNVSLSSLAAELHSPLTTIQWVTSGYLLALALVLPLNGWLVDRIGARSVYLWCFSAFTLASATCGFAWSANALIAFRVLQGMAGGLLAPMAQMMMARAAGRQLARVAGYTTLPILMGPILGPVIAGAILQHASWRWLFFVNVPVGALALLLACRFLPDDRSETRLRPLDLAGLALLSPAMVLFLYGSDHLESPAGRAALAAALVFLSCFIWRGTRKGRNALIDLDLFRRKVFPVSAATQFLANGISFAGQMLIPFFLIRACGQSPGMTGLLMMPLGLGMACSYRFLGSLTRRLGLRKVAACGSFLSLLATLPFLYLAGRGLALAVLIPALFFRGAGMAGVGIPSMTAAYVSVRRRDLPAATTSLNIVQRLGGPTLTTACATFLAWRMNATGAAAGLPGAFVAAFGLLCAFHTLVFLSALRLPLSVDHAVLERPGE
jgi:EmrB/QacA subfamily drug resistance transporter